MLKFSKILGFAKEALNTNRTLYNISNSNNEADKALHIFPYGFKSAPKEGDSFVTCNNNNPSNKVILGGVFKTKELNENEVLIYSQNNSILLKANGNVEIQGNNLNINAKGTTNITADKVIINSNNINLGGKGGAEVLTTKTKFEIPAGGIQVQGSQGSAQNTAPIQIKPTETSKTTRAK